MNVKRKQKINNFSHIIGSVLIIVPNGIFWYWGNLSVLTLSYVLFYLPSDSGIETPWIISLYIVFRALGLIMYDLCKKTCGHYWNTIFGIAMSETAIFSCYFAVQNSLVLLNVMLGPCLGFGSGLLYGQALKTVVEIGGAYKEFLMCLVQGSFATGAMIINEFVTLYANPTNVSPDFKRGFSMYFSHKKVLDKVPSLYLYLGSFSLMVHVIAFILQNQMLEVHEEENKDVYNDSNNYEIQATDFEEINHDIGATFQTNDPHARNACSNLQDNPTDYSPSDLLKTAAFYALWVSFFLLDFPFLLVGNYYKALGQMWIHDDHFLTYLGTGIIFVNTWIRGLWGVFFSKCRLGTSLVLVFTPILLLNTWCFLTAMVNRWLYFFCTLLWAGFIGAAYSLFSAIMALRFGKSHFTINFGLLSTSSILVNIGGPVLIEVIISSVGWFAMYMISVVLFGIGFVALLFFF